MFACPDGITAGPDGPAQGRRPGERISDLSIPLRIGPLFITDRLENFSELGF